MSSREIVFAAAGAGGDVNYIDECFSTYLYTGNGSTQTITNGIDLSGKGGLTWIKRRGSGTGSHQLFDTVRGVNKYLRTNGTDAQDANGAFTDLLTSFNSNGFTLGADASAQQVNSVGTGDTYCSWTFREQAKFFDVVTYTGNGVAGRTVAHNLGSVPGMIIVKRTDNTGDWFVYHRSNTANPETDYLRLNSPLATIDLDTVWNDTAPTSTVFSVGTNTGVNASSGTYVAYLFAHNAGGFGTSGTDNVISCGGFTIGASNVTIDLGYEPQYVLIKQSSDIQNWLIFDMMRGFNLTDSIRLAPDTSGAEAAETLTPVTSTGFTVTPGLGSASFVYMAIRRPMKPPTSGTEVFYPLTIAQADNIDSTGVPFAPDLVNTFSRNGTSRTTEYNQFQFADRLRGLGTPNNTLSGLGCPTLISSSTAAEGVTASYIQLKADSRNITRGAGWNLATLGNWVNYFFKRASGFFDVVCYTGTGGGAPERNHNLGVVPEFIITKRRDAEGPWRIYVSSLGNTKYLGFAGNGERTSSTIWDSTTPTSTQFFVGNNTDSNTSGGTYVAYLFATLAGVSKVGSYTGNGGTQAIACGFTSGARFVLIQRTDTDGFGSYVYDTARGMTTLTDPYLALNSTAAETATLGSVTTTTGGFTVNAAVLAAINTNGASYIFLAIS